MPRHKLPFSYYRRKDSGYFFYKLKDWPKYKAAGTKLEHEVLQLIQRELARQEEGIQGPRITLKEFASGFFDQGGEWVGRQRKRNRPFSPVMSQMRRGHLENHILPEFGKRQVDDIQMHELEDWLLELKLSAQTVNHIRSTLSLVFQEAKRKNLISFNLVKDIESLPASYRERSAFTLEECTKLFPQDWDELLGIWKYPRWAVMHYLMLTTGMRVGEATALQWRHIVWDRGGILILQAIKADGTIGLPKSGKPRAAIMPGRTLDLLRKWSGLTPYPDSEHFVFYGHDGMTHLNVKYVSKIIKGALVEAKIDPGERVLVAHSLRHTYNTRMERLIPEAVLRYMIGHQSRKMTERYTHVEPAERLKELAESQGLLDEVWN